MENELNRKYLLAVCEQGNLTRAARSLGITQPALSAAVSTIEKKMGFQIFDRKRTPVVLTQEGRLYLEFLQKQRLLAEDYKKRIEELLDNTRGKVVIGGSSVYAESVIAYAAAELYNQHPGFEVALKNASVPELMKMAKEGIVDCFVSTSDHLPKGFGLTEIKEERIYLCIPKDWPVNQKLTEYQVKLGEEGTCFDYTLLNSLGFIFLEPDQPLQIEMEKFFEKYKLSVQKAMQVNQVSVGVELTALGTGICFASEEALRNSKHINRISLYVLPDTIASRKIYVAYDQERYRSYACMQFIEVLQNIQ